MNTITDVKNCKYIADLHFGDKHHAGRYSETVKEYADRTIEELNAQLTKDTILILVGDIICDISFIDILDKLKCKECIHIIGNRESRNDKILRAIVNKGKGGYSSLIIDGVLVTHLPPHSHEGNKYRHIIHGHLHNNRIFNHKYTNVSSPVRKGKLFNHTDLPFYF